MSATDTRWHANAKDPQEFGKAVLAWLRENGVDIEKVSSVTEVGEHTYEIEFFPLRDGSPYYDREIKGAARDRTTVTITAPPPPRPV